MKMGGVVPFNYRRLRGGSSCLICIRLELLGIFLWEFGNSYRSICSTKNLVGAALFYYEMTIELESAEPYSIILLCS